MKKQHIVLSGLVLSALLIFLLNERNNRTASLGGKSSPDQQTADQGSENSGVAMNGSGMNESKTHSSTGTTLAGNDGKQEATKKDNNCFSFSYQHQSKNQNRDIEDFLNDTNAFPILSPNVNQKSICVKVNNKPVGFKLSKKDGKTEVLIGSVVGPESTIQVSYCVGNVPCKESCVVKNKNKVDDLLSDAEMGGLENAELETQVKELRNVASAHGDLMDSTIIRDWNKLQSKEWICAK